MKDQLLQELIESIGAINAVEEKIYNYVNTLDEVQDKIMDIEHFLEDHNISRNGSINLIKLLQDLRLERRQIKQMWEIWKVYGSNREKLKQKDYREFLINDLRNMDKKLQTKYNYKVLTEEYLESLNEDINLPRGRKKKTFSYNNIEEEINV